MGRRPPVCRDERCGVHNDLGPPPAGWRWRCQQTERRFAKTKRRGGSFRGVKRER